jgi:hypothetical protein
MIKAVKEIQVAFTSSILHYIIRKRLMDIDVTS